MSIPDFVTIKHNLLPDEPGVYFHKDARGKILYIGKATSLKNRVSTYFNKAHDNRISELVSKIRKIDYIVTPTVIEALVLEANQIKKYKPHYNILLKDNKSFLYLCITNEEFPKPLLLRGHDLEKYGIKPFQKDLSKEAKEKFLAVFGPYTSGPSLRKALEFVRKFIPWSTCESPEVKGNARPCFNYHIRKCPGVCTGKISSKEYKKIIRDLIDFFSGNKSRIAKRLKSQMEKAAKAERFEEAARFRNKLFAIEHIRDVALITKEDVELPYEKVAHTEGINLDGRIEAYDISNISGTSTVGVMTVFNEGAPDKSQYRKFKIKTVEGANDVASMEEMIRRRLRRAELYPKAWPLPEVMVIDGGKPQVNRVQAVLDELGVKQHIIGIAKGPDRKQDRLIYDRTDQELLLVAQRGKETFQKVRDEAHRFAVSYHKQLRRKSSGIPKKKRKK